MHEIEAKVLNIDRAAVESALHELGAVPGPEQRFSAIFFDFPDGRLGDGGQLLRLRQEGDRSVLTFKRRVHGEVVKVRAETEVTVGDFQSCRQLLNSLRLAESATVDEFRTSYRLGAASIAIDRHVGGLSFIPEFLEIEAGSVEEIRSVAARLGFRSEHLRPWGLAQLVDHYRRRG